MDAVRMLKANLKLEGKLCGWCQVPLTLGDDAAVCTGCEKQHHRGCWDTRAGCATAGCTSAPLRRLDLAAPAAGAPASPFPTGFVPGAAPPAAPLGSGMMRCPRCGLSISIASPLCPACRAVTSPDGIYHGPISNAPGAVKSLVLGLIGLFVCGIILGPIAISSANQARDAMARDPSLGGEGLATAGKVLGVLDIVGFILVIIYRASKIP